MSYASILLHIENTRHRRTAADVALTLSKTYQAYATALHVSIPDASGYYPLAPNPESVRRAEAEADKQDAGLKAEFDRHADRLSVSRTEWRFHLGTSAGTDLATMLALHAQCADLVVMGQHDGRERDSHTGYDTPAAVALASARPVLVLPHSGHFDSVGQRIILAWDASIQATRMASAALPLLARAEEVEIVMVDEGKNMAASYGETPGSDIALYLARHGVEVTTRELDRNGLSVAETLLSAVAERGADLLCTGAYGQSRLRELTFGGVTFDLMRYMTVPTLIAC